MLEYWDEFIAGTLFIIVCLSLLPAALFPFLLCSSLFDQLDDATRRGDFALRRDVDILRYVESRRNDVYLVRVSKPIELKNVCRMCQGCVKILAADWSNYRYL